MGIDGTKLTQLYVSSETFYLPTWSPDSKFIVAISDWNMYIFDIAENTVTKKTSYRYINPEEQLCWVY